ncbi:MAG: DUF1343 domain-containing protein [Thermodesulfobacteriota bacterium]|nr:DUF1343 domain-containing protein [Thermodesulfobacteriota bacterium]
MNRPKIKIGIEQLLSDPPQFLMGRRLGLLCNQASTDSSLVNSRDLVNGAFPGQLTCLFSPQHGFFSEKQDNMIESGHQLDQVTGLPVFSLYGDRRKPTAEMFDHLDVLLIDLVDVGTRVYTFIYTMAYCLEAAAEHGKKVVILDRPNPLGGMAVEGNLLHRDVKSFVGLYPVPMRHGLTIGELALYFNDQGIGADLTVVPMSGWKRSMFFKDTELPWVYPSPNMPSADTAFVYSGQVIWEGTNISEGRGTTLPFELFGAPFVEPDKVSEELGDTPLPGCFLRPLAFEPTSNKWAGKCCRGFQLHVTDPQTFLPYRTTLALLRAIMRLYPGEFCYKEPPYEYEFEKLPLDLILGDHRLRKALEQETDIVTLEKSWQAELDEFDLMRKKYFLYD